MKGTIAMLFAPLDEKTLVLLVLVLIMIVLDVVVGVAQAFMSHTFATEKMREGLYHKASLMMILLLGWLCDTAMIHVPELGLPQMIMFACEVLIFIMELASIMENLVKINPDLADNPILRYFTSKVDTDSDES